VITALTSIEVMFFSTEVFVSTLTERACDHRKASDSPAIPLIALLGLGHFIRTQISRIESLSRFVVDTQIQSLAALGSIARCMSEMRVSIRNYLRARDAAEEETISSRSHEDVLS